MQLSHGVSSLVVVGQKVTSCLYAAARVSQRFLLVLGAAFDAPKLRCALPAVCGRLKQEVTFQPSTTSDETPSENCILKFIYFTFIFQYISIYSSRRRRCGLVRRK